MAGNNQQQYQEVREVKTIEIIEPIQSGFERQIMADLEEAGGSDIEVNINCVGGDVKETLGVCNRFSNYPGKVTANIIGIAASCASWVPVYCNHVTMRKNALLMIHNATAKAGGDWRALEKASSDLKMVNQQIAGMAHDKTGLAVESILDYMEKETFFDANKAKELGFVDEIIDAKAVSFQNLVGFEAIANKLPAEAIKQIPESRLLEIENQLRLQRESNNRLRLKMSLLK